MCTPTRIYIDNVKTKDLKIMDNTTSKTNKKATKFVQELIFNAIMGVSLVALIFGFVILMKVLIG